MEITTFRLKVWFLWEYLMFSSNILARIISTREKVSDTRTGETHCGGILLEESTKIELLLPGKLWDNTAPKFIFASLSSPIGYVRCKPCSWLNLCRAYGRQNKIRYCCSSFNFQLHCSTKRSSLQLCKKKKNRKENRKNERYPRCSESCTFRCSALNALSRNYDICISHGKNLSKRRLIRKVQPTNFESKPKTERKDQLHI